MKEAQQFVLSVAIWTLRQLTTRTAYWWNPRFQITSQTENAEILEERTETEQLKHLLTGWSFSFSQRILEISGVFSDLEEETTQKEQEGFWDTQVLAWSPSFLNSWTEKLEDKLHLFPTSLLWGISQPHSPNNCIAELVYFRRSRPMFISILKTQQDHQGIDFWESNKSSVPYLIMPCFFAPDGYSCYYFWGTVVPKDS